MNARFRMYRRRGGIFYLQDRQTGKQESLGTRDKREAQEVLTARNRAARQPALNLAMARAFMSASDPKSLDRRWSDVFAELATHGRESSQDRVTRAAASPDFDPIRDKVIIETTAEDVLAVLHRGGAATNYYMRRFHNLAVDLAWLPGPLLPKRAWPHVAPRRKRRGITVEEFEKIVRAEQNEERRRYYRILWETGAAQTDAALLTAENIDWENQTLVYERKKLQDGAEPCRLRIGANLGALLRTLPSAGLLFPSIAKADPRHRSAEFCRRCRILGIKGVSLHSFRYAWAERACAAGYPERYAQAALGHGSKAVHRAYARGAKVLCPPLEDFEHPAPANVIPFKTATA